MPFNRESLQKLLDAIAESRRNKSVKIEERMTRSKLAELTKISRSALYRHIDKGDSYEPTAQELDGMYQAARILNLGSLQFYREPEYETDGVREFVEEDSTRLNAAQLDRKDSVKKK